jgi:DNA methylase
MATRPGRARSTKAQDAGDLSIMRRELRAARRTDGSIAGLDIRGRQHEANVAAQWVKTRARKHQQAQAKGQRFNEGAYLREHLGIGVSTMETWIVILRNWDLYVRRRSTAGSTGYSGSSYARALIRDESFDTGTDLRGSQSRSAHGYERLKNAVARATRFQGLYDALRLSHGEEAQEQIAGAAVSNPIEPTVRLPYADLYHADCTHIMPSLPNESVDLATWDLPYGMTSATWDESIDLNQLWVQTMRLLKPHGVVLAFAVQPLTSRLVSSQPELYRCQWHRLIANSTNFLRTDIYPLRVIEDILMFSASGQFNYTPPPETLDSPYRVPVRPHRSRIYRLSTKMFNRFAGTKQEAATPISLLDFALEPGEQQIETQKPISLLSYLIETYTTAGATVLDPTGGAFSTGVACWKTGRRFIGVEKLSKHFRIGISRLEGAMEATAIHHPAAAD